MIAIIKGLWASFRLLPILAQIAGPLVVAGSIYGAYALWRHSIYTEGYDAAIADIAAENIGAVDAAAKARVPVQACFDRGGTWDSIKRLCIPAPG